MTAVGASGTVAPDPTDESLSVPIRSLLFGPLGATHVPSAVVRRLRAAIALGLLADGRRLPKEADLAAEMGITVFALREALAELRKQGLLVTKAGKYGGSFVAHPADSDDLERAELLSLSSAELRDLGDWRAMLASHAAALAAQRISSVTHGTLEAYAHRVEEAATANEARCAHGRFHLELASAAQSMRLARAEFAVHEQIDWLFGLALQTPEERGASARALTAVANAVRDHDPIAARAAAEAHIDRLLQRLAKLRLKLIAQTGSAPADAGRTSPQDEIGSILDRLVTELAEVANHVAPALGSGLASQEIRTRVSLASLQRLDAFPAFVKGVGIVAEVGIVPDYPYWIQWWLKTASGPVEDNHHVMDPEREDFYAYQDKEFMSRPRETHQPCASGPYVDYGGVDDYIVTIACPVLHDGVFVGISCADVCVADLESWLAPWLATTEETYLVNADDRVIVSNSVNHGPGDLVTPHQDCRVTSYAVLGWRLLDRSRV